MGLRSSLRWVSAVACMLSAAGPATAQSAGGGAHAETAAGAGARGQGQVGFEQHPHLTPQEELSQAELILARMDHGSVVVRNQLESARAARDVVKTLCLNDKLSQINVAVRSGRERRAALQAAAQRSDSDLANHEFTIVTVLGQRGDHLLAEANQCLGDEVAFVGQTQIVTQIDPNIPGEDTTAYPAGDPALISGPPVAASPTM